MSNQPVTWQLNAFRHADMFNLLNVQLSITVILTLNVAWMLVQDGLI